MVSNKVITVGLWAIGWVLLVVIGSGNTVQGITCSRALRELDPCTFFVVGPDPCPLPPAVRPCKEANNPAIREQICKCIKDAAAAGGFSLIKARKIPYLCHVQLPINCLGP
ncbi:hypothetical protein MANES_12G053300v8 [Manihot esculenta]|uniref:Bifunctional inhibitor/plant lipid transfer protein/seed storage helical domain-containing protein n=2 Tax=Manihot esculenta TaxID=3983 RepID=A0A2C9UUX2_MANES|nr:hypothetical protein MANES_12G053300v8 [Manihot esculenta]